MSALPRGTCPCCGHDVALRVHGEMREHRWPSEVVGARLVKGAMCSGSGLTVDECQAEIDREIAALRRMSRR